MCPFFLAVDTADCPCSFFPLKHIDKVGTFQDVGPLENDPLLSALLETEATFLLAEEPDFIISLGTGEPKMKYDDISADTSVKMRRNGAFSRLCRMF